MPSRVAFHARQQSDLAGRGLVCFARKRKPEQLVVQALDALGLSE